MITPTPFTDHAMLLTDPGFDMEWTIEQLAIPSSTAICGDIVASFTNLDGSPLDPELFNVDYNSNPQKF